MTLWTPNDDGHADLTSHDAFASGPPHATFARMRAEAPVCWTGYAGGQGFWSVTRHADITAMLRDYATFSSARGIRMEDQTYEEYLARRTFQETDPPEHTHVRKKVMRAFSRPVVAGFEDDIRALSVDILDYALQDTEFDATKAIARELPMRMLGRILGVPEADLPWLVQKGDALIANTDPDFTDHVLDKLDTDEFRMMPFNSPAGAELYAYARELMADKAARGDTDGILHMILAPDEDGETISETEFRNFFCLLVAAGNDTTRYSIAAGMQALARQPGLLDQVASGAVDDTMADEFIRWATPATYFRRTAARDIEVHGQTIRAGDKVLLWFASANRDDAVFEDPLTVDPGRKPNPHLSFGQGGPHVCLGMHLARLEVRVLFQELTKRIAGIEMAGTEKFLRSNFVGGIKSLPVRVTLR
ncbi:cytochrome P450 [Anianabacter salinae]|uniref:cytochrome P450 n=1 Tax=Anianabacter salinae TaxID=2851023 RepID=UPI00225DFAF7|nr:cytochrome P450 [Anianabacter salinae]MBV0911765.1 cytochrome P450 [Anianabacter salinae]